MENAALKGVTREGGWYVQWRWPYTKKISLFDYVYIYPLKSSYKRMNTTVEQPIIIGERYLDAKFLWAHTTVGREIPKIPLGGVTAFSKPSTWMQVIWPTLPKAWLGVRVPQTDYRQHCETPVRYFSVNFPINKNDTSDTKQLSGSMEH